LAVAEPFALGHAHRVWLSRFAEETGAELVIDAVVEVDDAGRQVRLRDGRMVGFEALLAPGGRAAAGVEAPRRPSHAPPEGGVTVHRTLSAVRGAEAQYLFDLARRLDSADPAIARWDAACTTYATAEQRGASATPAVGLSRARAASRCPGRRRCRA
jgi:hypothetical protein